MNSRFGTRFTTFSLFAVILFVLGGLVVTQVVLGREDETQAESEARQSASIVEEYIAVHAAALTSFHVFFPGTTSAQAAERDVFLNVVNALTEHTTGYRRVWIADSSGRVLQAQTFGDSVVAPPMDLDLDTLPGVEFAHHMRLARQTLRAQISAPGPLGLSDSGVVLIQPILHGQTIVGFAGAILSQRALLQGVADSAMSPTRTTLYDGARVVAQSSGGRFPRGAARQRITASAPVRVPGGGPWQLVVEHPATSGVLRATIWSVGLSVLLVLTLALMHERRQAWRISERSSELERLSSELLTANRAKSEFLANISHELRTPLNAIVGFADLLRDGVYGELSPRQAPPVQRIEASATHLRLLVDQILDLAKIAAGRLEVHPETIDLRPFVLDVASEVESLINEKGLSLSIAVGATLPRVRTDPTHLRQILVNLIGNAVKYTQTGGVAIRTRLVSALDTLPQRGGGTISPPVPAAGRGDSRWIALQVIDTGVGIAAEDRERIFEEFEQVNAGPRGESMQRGTGLGLPISRRLARLIGGDVTLDSEPGRGSTFTVWLPVE